MAQLQVNYGGLKLANPIIVASAGITGSKERVLRCAENGAGAVVLKTCFQEELHAKSPTPRFEIIRRKLGRYTSTTLYSYEQGYEHGLGSYLEMIRDLKRETDMPIIASIGGLDDEHWVDWCRLVQEAGADAVELNTSCPHGHIFLEGSDHLRTIVSHVTEIVKQAVRIPVFTKMSPQMSDPLANALAFEKAGADGVVMFSRFPGIDIDTETEHPILHGGSGGHGGPWAIHYALYWISLTYPVLRIPISGCGGVISADDVVKYLLVGANTVQVASAVIVEGYGIIRKLRDGLEAWMNRRGYADLASFRGRAVPRIKKMQDVDRRKLVRALINPDLCNGCGICQRACIYDAAIGQNECFVVNDRCDGCGLCPHLCPTGAITMVPREA